MSDAGAQITTEAEAPERDPIAEAMARFDAATQPTVAALSGAITLGGHHLPAIMAAIRTGLFAALAALAGPADEPEEPSRDETHASIDPHTGQPTAEAIVRQAELRAEQEASDQAKANAEEEAHESAPLADDPGASLTPGAETEGEMIADADETIADMPEGVRMAVDPDNADADGKATAD